MAGKGGSHDMPVFSGIWRISRQSSRSALLAAMLLVASFAPGSVAFANPTTDKLNECLNIGGALVDGVEAGVTAAAKIAQALADPVNAACMGEASAGNPVMIGFMAAMTGIFVAVTADGEQRTRWQA